MTTHLHALWKINKREIERPKNSSSLMDAITCVENHRDRWPEPDKKSDSFKIRATADVIEVIRMKARKLGLPTNRFILAVLLGTDYKLPVTPEVLKILFALNGELTSHGQCFREIAGHFKTDTKAYREGLELLETLRVPLTRTLASVREALTQGTPQP